jgi:hypothetical protein
MKMPEFTAEASLRPAMGRYYANTVFGGPRGVGVSPTQESMGASGLTHNAILWPPPWERRVWCCAYDWAGRPRCNYFYVPVWYDCDVIYNPLPCFICRPPVVHP